MRRVVADDYTFVTDNAHDFRKLFAREPLHAGLVVIVPNVPQEQQELFLAVLDQLPADRDLVNRALEVSRSPAGDVALRRYESSPGDGNSLNTGLIGSARRRKKGRFAMN